MATPVRRANVKLNCIAKPNIPPHIGTGLLYYKRGLPPSNEDAIAEAISVLFIIAHPLFVGNISHGLYQSRLCSEYAS